MSERSQAMATSVSRIGAIAGLAPDALALLSAAHAVGMEPRLERLDDDHHPAYLHPGRTALILLRDVGALPGAVVAAAMVHETADAELRVDPGKIGSRLEEEGAAREVAEEVAEIVAELPLPNDERLAEKLVTLDGGSVLAALAERLDQLRHAHMRDDWDDALRRWMHDQAGEIWGPMAERTHPRLADRFRNWHRAFARRLG